MMTDEIRKLLGGYATDTLSESERAALFEAALEDQELFEALQNEDALRELLADPVSRDQIRQALRPAGLGRSRAWWRRGWIVGSASLAVAASIAIALVWQRPPVRPAATVQMAQKVEPKLEAPVPAEPPRTVEKKALRLIRPKVEVAAPAPAAGLVLPEQQQQVPGQQLQPQDQIGQAINGVPSLDATKEAVPPLRKEALAPTIAAAVAPLYNGPLVRYSVLRSKAADDGVRIEVVSQIPGYMALYRANAEGQWQRVYPVNDAEVAIAANTAYQIPDAPIAVRDNREKLRLVIEPAARASFANQLTGGSLNAPRAKALDQKASGPAPLVIEIPIGH